METQALAGATPLPSGKYEEYAALLRGLSQHEDNLINHRLTWFTTLQGLLFAALAFVWKEADIASAGLSIVISLMGLTVAYSTRCATRCAKKAHEELQRWWRENLAVYAGPSRVGLYMNQGEPENDKMPWQIVPPCFMAAWGIIICLVAYKLYEHTQQPTPVAATAITVENKQAKTALAIHQGQTVVTVLEPRPPAPR